MSAELHLPPRGFAALDSLDQVPWNELAHAYTGRQGSGLLQDVAASLAALRAPRPGEALRALSSNLYHQRTVYPATAYAIPYLAAVMAEPLFVGALRLELMELVVGMALSSMWVSRDGMSPGAFGEGTGPKIRAALRLCAGHLRAAAELEPLIAETLGPLEALAAAEPPAGALFETLRQGLVALEAEIERRLARGERFGPPAP